MKWLVLLLTIFFTLVSFCAHASAKDCRSDYILQEFKSCADSSHPPIYKLASDKACAPVYKSCRGDPNDRAWGISTNKDIEDVTFSFPITAPMSVSNDWCLESRHIFAGDLRDDDSPFPMYDLSNRAQEKHFFKLWCTKQAKIDYDKDGAVVCKYLLDEWQDGYLTISQTLDNTAALIKAAPPFATDFLFWQNYNLHGGYGGGWSRNQYGYGINLNDGTPWHPWQSVWRPAISPLPSGPFDPDIGGRNINCLVTYHMSIPPVRQSSVCGLDHYEPCRDPSHGLEGYEEKRTRICGVDPGSVRTESTPKDQEDRQTTCAILSDMPDSTTAEIDKKINELRLNLALLDGADSKLGQASSRLSIELEIFRLQEKKLHLTETSQTLDQIANLLITTRSKVEPLLVDYAAQFPPGLSPLAVSVERALEEKRPLTVMGLLNLYPAEAAPIIDKYRPSFLDLDGDSFAAIFSSGLVLPPADTNSLRLKLETNSLGDHTYRALEVYVRSVLAQLREIQNQLMRSLSLRSRIQLAKDNLLSVFDAGASASGLSDSELKSLDNQFGALSAETEHLRQAEVKFLSERISILENQKESTISELWKVVDFVRGQSNDPRFAVEAAYKALQQVDANSFTMAVNTALANLKNAPSADEATLSLRLLMGDAHNDLINLRELQTLLSTVADDRGQAAGNLMQQLNLLLMKQSVPDVKLVSMLNQAMAAYDSGPGADINLGFALSKQIDETYGDFIQALDQASNAAASVIY
jgi:hypothetical protein